MIINDLDGYANAGLIFILDINRDPYFFMVYYIVPSVIFIIISYCSYWIDQESVTARCFIAMTTVLITIKFQNGINDILPPIDYPVWIESYFTGVLIFTCFTMLEYAVVNFCQTNYKDLQQQIDDNINNLRDNLSKYKKKFLKTLDSKKILAQSIISQRSHDTNKVEVQKEDRHHKRQRSRQLRKEAIEAALKERYGSQTEQGLLTQANTVPDDKNGGFNSLLQNKDGTAPLEIANKKVV